MNSKKNKQQNNAAEDEPANTSGNKKDQEQHAHNPFDPANKREKNQEEIDNEQRYKETPTERD